MSPFVAEILKIIFFIIGFVFSASYLIPKGIKNYQKWKETKKSNNLSIAVSSICGGIFLLLYLFFQILINSNLFRIFK